MHPDNQTMGICMAAAWPGTAWLTGAVQARAVRETKHTLNTCRSSALVPLDISSLELNSLLVAQVTNMIAFDQMLIEMLTMYPQEK